jgi:hypothetical protein
MAGGGRGEEYLRGLEKGLTLGLWERKVRLDYSGDLKNEGEKSRVLWVLREKLSLWLLGDESHLFIRSLSGTLHITTTDLTHNYWG